jgi:hypothetical protein
VPEWAPEHVANQALGFEEMPTTDTGDAWAELRKAAEITVVRSPDGFLDFMTSPPDSAGATATGGKGGQGEETHE